MLTQTVAGRVWDYSHNVGGRYTIEPAAAAIGPGDVVYVLSKGIEQIPNVAWNKTNHQATISKITTGTVPRDELLLNQFSRSGDGPGELIWPAGIAVDSQENVYVTDEWLNRVSIFDKDGNFLTMWGTTGGAKGEMSGASGIVIDGQDDLYIADTRNHRIQKFTKEGKFLTGWGSKGSGQGELDSPWGICLDSQGYVYVADHKNNRVQKFTHDGGYVATFGKPGTGRGELRRPSDVTVDPDGDVYVCDWANDRVQTFDADGKFITSFEGDAQDLSKWHQESIDANPDMAKARRRAQNLELTYRFDMPRAVEFDAAKNRLLVVETNRGRIQIYNKLREYLMPQGNL